MRPANVLVVDDNSVIRLQIKTLLTDLGYSVIGEADNGGQALSLARSLKPDIIIVNLAMETSQSGSDVAKIVSAERVGAVILYSGNADADVLSALETVGAMGFLSQPFRASDVVPTLFIATARLRDIKTLETEIKDLNERMEARKLVGRAKAILMEKHGLSEREAFYRIQTQSTALGKQSHEIARAIITASELAG